MAFHCHDGGLEAQQTPGHGLEFGLANGFQYIDDLRIGQIEPRVGEVVCPEDEHVDRLGCMGLGSTEKHKLGEEVVHGSFYVEHQLIAPRAAIVARAGFMRRQLDRNDARCALNLSGASIIGRWAVPGISTLRTAPMRSAKISHRLFT